MDDDIDTAFNRLEESLAHIWDQADADYIERHYPWHTEGDPICRQHGGDHTHRGPDNIVYYPERVHVDRPR